MSRELQRDNRSEVFSWYQSASGSLGNRKQIQKIRSADIETDTYVVHKPLLDGNVIFPK